MEMIMEHWLSLAAGVFLLAMVLYGHYRGCVRIAITLLTLIVNLFFVRLATPYITMWLREYTNIPQWVEGVMSDSAGLDKLSAVQMPAQQRMAIEQLKIPGQMKELLLENNNQEIYHILGVDTFLDYVGTSLTNMVLNFMASIIMFALVYLLLRMVTRWLNLMVRLPILSGLNQIAGALLGGIQGLLWLWSGCVLVEVCSRASWAAIVFQQIQSSLWLSFLYRNNLINWLFRNILQSLF